jgi:hypothetical protein
MGGGAFTKVRVCPIPVACVSGNNDWTLKRLYVKTVGGKGPCQIFEFYFRCWREMVQVTRHYIEPSHDFARSKLFVRCKMVTKRTSLKMSHVKLVTILQELWNKPSTCVRQRVCGPLTHVGRTSLHGIENGIREGHAEIDEWSFVSGLRTCLLWMTVPWICTSWTRQ